MKTSDQSRILTMLPFYGLACGYDASEKEREVRRCQKTCHHSSGTHEAPVCFSVVFIFSSVYFRSWTRQAAMDQMIAGFSPHPPNTQETCKSSGSGSHPLLPSPGKDFRLGFSQEIDQSQQNLEILWINSYSFPSPKFAYLPRKKT